MIRLHESLRALFYAPYYLAFELDAFAEQGLEVVLGRPGTPADAAQCVFDGRADVAWGGPMRMMQFIDQHGPQGPAPLVGFAEAVRRDPFYLVGREPNPDYRASHLRGLRIAIVSEVPTPWLCLRDDLERAGVDTRSLDIIADRSMTENVDALRAGELDVVQLFEPHVEILLHEGSGHLWYAGASRGLTTYTTLYTSRRFAEAHPDTLRRMTRAVHAAQRWLHAHDASEIARRIARYFPDLPHERMEGALARYLEHAIWGREPVMSVEGFVRLKCALIAAGFIGRDIPFESCIDNRYAVEQMAQ